MAGAVTATARHPFRGWRAVGIRSRQGRSKVSGGGQVPLVALHSLVGPEGGFLLQPDRVRIRIDLSQISAGGFDQRLIGSSVGVALTHWMTPWVSAPSRTAEVTREMLQRNKCSLRQIAFAANSFANA